MVMQVCANLYGGWADDTVEELAQQAGELQALKQDIVTYRTTIASAREQLSASTALLKQMQQLSLRIMHMKEYLPQHMPQAAPQQKSRPKKSPSEESKEQQPPTIQPKV